MTRPSRLSTIRDDDRALQRQAGITLIVAGVIVIGFGILDASSGYIGAGLITGGLGAISLYYGLVAFARSL